jgi:hypothetical protein
MAARNSTSSRRTPALCVTRGTLTAPTKIVFGQNVLGGQAQVATMVTCVAGRR